jgi:FlgD Ig-like domain
MKRFMIIAGLLLSITTVLYAASFLGTEAGNGGNSAENTFHFDNANSNFQMGKPDGSALASAEMAMYSGTAFKIFNDNEDWIAKLNLTVAGADLSGANWSSSVYPAMGIVAIDPSSGRFKFAAPAWQGAGTIDSGPNRQGGRQKVAMNDNGQAVSIFRQWVSSAGRIFVNHYRSATGWGTAQILDPGGLTCDYPKIALNAEGNAIAVYQRSEAVYRVYACQYHDGGAWDSPVELNSDTNENAQYPEIANTSSGNGVCVFEETLGAYARVFARLYSPGSGWYAAVTIDAGDGHSASLPHIAMNDSDQAVCVFSQQDGSSVTRIYANYYTPATGWGGATLMDNGGGAGNHGSHPRININSSGQAVCVFNQDNSGVKRVYGNRYLPGFGWQTAQTIDIDYGVGAGEPEMDMNENDEAFSIFSQFDGSTFYLNAAHYLPATGWQTPVPIDSLPAGGTLSYASIHVNDAGKAVAVYSRKLSGEDEHAYAASYVPDVGWQTPVQIDDNQNTNYLWMHADMNNAGQAMAVFERYDPSTDDRVMANVLQSEVPYDTIKVNYYTEVQATPTATTIPIPTQDDLIITNAKIEPTAGEISQIQYHLAQAGLVSIKIYNLNGTLVATLVDEYHAAGSYSVQWAAKNTTGVIVASGVYIVHIQTPSTNKTKKIVVIK